MASRLKKRLAAVLAAASLCTGIALTASPPAAAATSGEFNISHTPLGGKLLPRICAGGFHDESVWFYNNQTGQIYDHSKQDASPVYTKVGRHHYLSPHWIKMTGHCFYPVSSSWTLWGAEQRISNLATNCSSKSTMNLAVTESYATHSTTTRTVGTTVSAGGEVPWIPLEVSVSLDISRSWAYGKDHTWGQNVGIQVDSHRVGWIDAKPLKRQVRFNPHFKIDSYEWNWDQTRSGDVLTTGWAGNPSETSIVDRGYFYDAKSEVLDHDGNPVFNYIFRDAPAHC